jgi:hypothetical protein
MASNRSEQAGDQLATESLSQAEIRALAYFAIGVSSEGSYRGRDVSHDLAFAGNILSDSAMRPVGNSGYSIGTLQTDLGQHRGGKEEHFRFSREVHDDVPAELISSYQNWARRERPDLVLSDVEETQTLAELGRRGREMAGTDRFDIDAITKEKLETFLDSNAGRTYIHGRDMRQIEKLETAVFSNIADDSVYKKASIEDQARIATITAKLYNQSEVYGGSLVKKMQDGDFDNFAEVMTNGFTGKPDYVISGRDHALAGAEVFIALRNASVDNPLRQAWQGVLQDPLTNPTQLRSPDAMRCEAPAGAIPAIGTQILFQTPGQTEFIGNTMLPMRQPLYATNPNIAAEYETVKSLFLLPAEGKRFVEATDRGEAYAKVVSYKGGQTAGFFASSDNIAVWNRDGQGHALINNTWHEFRSADVAVVRNKDGTTDLNLVHGNNTTRLLHVDPAAPSFRNVRSGADSTEALQHSPETPVQPVQRKGGDSGGQDHHQEQSREITLGHSSTLLLDNPKHPNHAMFATLLNVVHDRDDKLGRPRDQTSVQLAGALTEQAVSRGLTTIGAAKFTDDGTKVGMTDTADLSALWAKTAVGDVGQLAGQKLSQSSENVAVINQQQALEQSFKPTPPAPTIQGPEDSSPKGPRLV